MDVGDIGFWVTNVRLPVEAPTNLDGLYHHAFHARELEERADTVGLEVVATWGLGAVPPLSRADYLLGRLGVD